MEREGKEVAYTGIAEGPTGKGRGGHLPCTDGELPSQRDLDLEETRYFSCKPSVESCSLPSFWYRGKCDAHSNGKGKRTKEKGTIKRN